MSHRHFIEGIHSMKKAINSLGSHEIKKKDELKIKLKEVNNLVSILEIVENLLYIEKKPDYHYCLSLCEEIKNFQRVTGEIFICKTLIKMNEEADALHRLRLLASNSLGYINIYFHIFELIKDRQQLKTLGKEMISKCQNCQIPTSLKVQAYIKYSRILCINLKPGKAISILRYIGKLLPRFPLKELPYTNFLRYAKNKDDLDLAGGKAIKTYMYSDFRSPRDQKSSNMTHILKNESHKTISPRSKPRARLRARSSKFSEVIQNSAVKKKFTKLTVDTAKQELFLGNLTELFEESENYDTETGFKASKEFGVSNDILFLYRIGKISMENKILLEDGFCALQDYLEIINYQKISEQRDIRIAKALYVKSLILLYDKKLILAVNILKNLLPKLQRFKLSKKAINAKEILSDLGYGNILS